MEATKHPIRRSYAIQVGFLLVGLLCGVLIVAAIKATEDVNHPAAPAAVVTLPNESPGVLGGRLGGIESADTANDAAIRNELGPSQVAGSLSRSVGENFVLPGDIDGGTLNGRVTQLPALRFSNSAGQRDINAASQGDQTDTYPIFWRGHDW